jgi:hypothetical protein
MKNLIYCVQNFKLTKLQGVVDTAHDQFFLQCAIECLRKMQQFEMIDTAVKSVRLPVTNDNNNHKTVNLPKDYYDFIRIGTCHNGIMINFDKNDSLCLDVDNCPCASESEIIAIQNNILNSQDNGYPTWWYPLWGQPYSYSYTIGSYGIGPGFYHGGYKLDLAKQQIILDAYVHAEEIVLEYIGDFVNDMGNALVPETYVQAVVKYIDFMRCDSSIDSKLYNRAATKYNQWYAEIRDINSKQQKLNKAQWVQLLRAYTYLGVKA